MPDNRIKEQIAEALNNKVRKAIDKGIDGAFADKQKNKIVLRTQLGIGVKEDGTAYALPKLSDNYRDQRQGKTRWYTTPSGKKVKMEGGNIKKPNLASTTRPAMSNLTATGQLLKSLTTVKLKFKGGIKWIIRISDNRGRDIYGNSSNIGNRELNGYLVAQGRRFMDFSNSQRNEIAREVRQILKRYLK